MSAPSPPNPSGTDPPELDPGVDDGAQIAREPILEVQLGFAGTLVAATTAVCWYLLESLQLTGLGSISSLFGAIAFVVVLQLFVIDHTWFLVQRGVWLGTVLLGRQDRRNLVDPGFQRDLEALYDAGSVRFFLGLSNAFVGTLLILTVVGASLLRQDLNTGGPIVGLVLIIPGLVLTADRILFRLWPRWKTTGHRWVRRGLSGLGVPWIDPPYATAHRRGFVPGLGRLILALALLVLDLAWVLNAGLVPAQEVVHRSQGEDPVLRFHLGGVRPSQDLVSVRLLSRTISEDMLLDGIYWMGDGMAVVLPVERLALGHHEVVLDEVRIADGQTSLNISRTTPAHFVVVE